MRWWASELVPHMLEYALANPRKHHWPENFAFHYVWTTAENQCLLALVDFVKAAEFRHLSLHYDGIMVDALRCGREADFGSAAGGAIANGAGFKVELVKKQSRTFLDILRSKADKRDSNRNTLKFF